jgi:hypothetical protein
MKKERSFVLSMVAFVTATVLILTGCAGKPEPITPAATALVPVVVAPDDSSGKALDTAIEEAATRIDTAFDAGTELALISVSSPSAQFSEYVLSYLETVLVNSGKLAIVDRANLDKIRAEQGFQLSGNVSDESAKAIGQMLGAGAIVTGSLVNLGDVQRLNIKSINVKTAKVSASYAGDIANSARVKTLLASGGGGVAGSGSVGASPSTGSLNSSGGGTPSVSKPAVIQRFTITFNPNGAAGSIPDAQTVQAGESITIPDVGAMDKARSTFGGWNTKADGTGTPYAAGDSFEVKNHIQLFAQWIEKVYKIGDRGPAGGWVFFDKGVFTSGWRYLEVAPNDLGPIQWGAWDTGLDGINTAIGTGKANTQRIVSKLEERGEDGASLLCSALNINGFTGWFLPSKDELDLMYKNLKQKGLGEFGNGLYWSSSQWVWSGNSGFKGAWAQKFSDGSLEGNYMGDNRRASYSIRAIRQF